MNGMKGMKNNTPDLDPGAKPHPTDLFFHVLAILHAPAYRDENAGA